MVRDSGPTQLDEHSLWRLARDIVGVTDPHKALVTAFPELVQLCEATVAALWLEDDDGVRLVEFAARCADDVAPRPWGLTGPLGAGLSRDSLTLTTEGSPELVDVLGAYGHPGAGVAVAIRSARGRVGVLLLGLEEPWALTDARVDQVESLASVAGAAVARSRSDAQQLRELSAYFHLSMTMAEPVDLHVMLDRLAKDASDWLELDELAVYTMPSARAQLDDVRFLSGAGATPGLAWPARLPHDVVATLAARPGMPVVWRSEGSAFSPEVPQGQPALSGVLLCLHTGERPVGVLVVGRRDPGLSGSAQRLMARVARHLAFTVEQALLRDDLHEARRRAVQAGAARSAFIAKMSPELRTPLAGIAGMLDHLADGTLDTFQRAAVDQCHSSAAQLGQVLDEVLEHVCVDHDDDLLEQTSFVLRDHIDLCVAAVAGLRPDVTLSHHIDPAVPLKVIGDPDRLGRLVGHLLHNAARFTHRGRIDVRVSVERRSPRVAWLRLEVQDTGVGIAPAELARILGAAPGDPTQARPYGAAGLGLAIARQLARMMEGELAAESVQDEGSTFSAVLRLGAAPADRGVVAPLVATPPTPQTSANEPPKLPRGPGPRILVVEDVAVNQRILTLTLAALGYASDVAANGAKAVEAMGRRHYDAVLMDVHMPVMDGNDATRGIRSLPGEAGKIPIIAVTANRGARDQAIAAGMNEVLFKPVDRTVLRDVLLLYAGEPEAALS